MFVSLITNYNFVKKNISLSSSCLLHHGCIQYWQDCYLSRFQYSIRRCISQSSGRWKKVALCPWYLTRYCDKTSWTGTAHIWNSNINCAIHETIMGFDWSIFLGLFYWHRDNSTIAAVPVNSLEGHGMMTSSNGNIFRVIGLLCEEFTVTGEFPSQRPATRNFDVFFDLHMNKRLSKQPRRQWFETSSSSLWRHCNG